MELTAARSYETKCLMRISFFFPLRKNRNGSDFVWLGMQVIDGFKKIFWWTASVLHGLLFAGGEGKSVLNKLFSDYDLLVFSTKVAGNEHSGVRG